MGSGSVENLRDSFGARSAKRMTSQVKPVFCPSLFLGGKLSHLPADSVPPSAAAFAFERLYLYDSVSANDGMG